jgi:hypothetical protein
MASATALKKMSRICRFCGLGQLGLTERAILTSAHGFCARARGGVDHWIPPPLRARTEGLVSLKQLSEVRLAHPLMLRQTLNLVQHPCVHPVISALGSDTVAAVHAELQDWKSSLQTRTLWLPALQGDLAGLSD